MVLPRPDSHESRLRFGVRLLVALLCAGALLQAMRPAVYSVRQGVKTVVGTPDAGAVAVREQQEYLSAELHRQIASGTRAQVVQTDDATRYKLSELATDQGISVVDADAQVTISVVTDAAASHGVRLVVSR